jgi:hypothetical protein
MVTAVFSSEADLQRVWAVMSAMPTCAVTPNIVSYDILLKACARFGDSTNICVVPLFRGEVI